MALDVGHLQNILNTIKNSIPSQIANLKTYVDETYVFCTSTEVETYRQDIINNIGT